MEMKIYKNADDFLRENKAVLEENAVQANLIWVNALSKKTYEDGFYGVSITDLDNVYLAIMSKPFPMVHFSTGVKVADMAELLFRYLFQNNILPEKVSGSKDTMDVFIAKANELGAGYKQSRYLYLRECTSVENIDIAVGEYQSPVIVDFDFTPWLLSFYKECELDDPIDNATERVQAMIESGSLVCYLDGGKVVTMAAKTRTVPGGRCVGMVYTPVQQRGKGYSLACMKHLTQEILDEGHKCAFLYADKYNPISNHVYEKLGYRKTGELIEYSRG